MSTLQGGRVLCTGCGYATNAEGGVDSGGSAEGPQVRTQEWYAERPSKKDPGLAMALSVLFLALGVLYTERVKEFLVFHIFGLGLLLMILYLHGFAAIGLVLLVLLWIIGIAWAHSRALDFNRDSKSHGFS